MRKLAVIVEVEVITHPNADALDLVKWAGWQCVAKRGDFKTGDLALVLEIDSWVPHELAPFLSKGKEPREYMGIKGERLRTIKLRGTTSQGLVMPLEILGEIKEIEGKKYFRINNLYSQTARTQNANLSNSEQENR
jgi:RNA ligase (TIGR02306 family)